LITLCGIVPPAPTTRFSTAESWLGWMKRVISLALIEKPCQLMIAFALLVMLSALPCVANVALPETTAGPVGFQRRAGRSVAAAPAGGAGTCHGSKPPDCLQACWPNVTPLERNDAFPGPAQT
jgi:hypothetical protein